MSYLLDLRYDCVRARVHQLPLGSIFLPFLVARGGFFSSFRRSLVPPLLLLLFRQLRPRKVRSAIGVCLLRTKQIRFTDKPSLKILSHLTGFCSSDQLDFKDDKLKMTCEAAEFSNKNAY